MSTACGFPPGVLHNHGADQCHEASRRAGAVEALREAAAELAESITFLNPARDIDMSYINCTLMDAHHLRDLADRIERGQS